MNQFDQKSLEEKEQKKIYYKRISQWTIKLLLYQQQRIYVRAISFKIKTMYIANNPALGVEKGRYKAFIAINAADPRRPAQKIYILYTHNTRDE